MRVRFTRDYAAHIEGQYRVENFRAGQEFSGPYAAQLVAGGCPVEVLDAAPAPEPEPDDDPDTDGADVDGDGVPDGSARQILDWVGEDPQRAAAAVTAEQGRDKPRAGLLAALAKLSD